ncbi:MAG TPA: hypothetical protein DCM45_03180 [Clostridiales bacterium]|nr:hypothetical protein [Clostridiales bacterium]
MDTIGKLLENNLTSHRCKQKNAIRSAGHSKHQSGSLLSFYKIEFDLDRLWQRMWELHSEESQLLDQI